MHAGIPVPQSKIATAPRCFFIITWLGVGQHYSEMKRVFKIVGFIFLGFYLLAVIYYMILPDPKSKHQSEQKPSSIKLSTSSNDTLTKYIQRLQIEDTYFNFEEEITQYKLVRSASFETNHDTKQVFIKLKVDFIWDRYRANKLDSHEMIRSYRRMADSSVRMLRSRFCDLSLENCDFGKNIGRTNYEYRVSIYWPDGSKYQNKYIKEKESETLEDHTCFFC